MKREILGDKKKVRYDESLVDKVNAKYASEVSGKKIIVPDQTVASPDAELNLPFYVTPPETKDLKTQKRWKEHWARIGCELMSMKEFYAYSKWIKKYGMSKSFITEKINDGSGLILDTLIKYELTTEFNEVTVRPMQRDGQNYLFTVQENRSVLSNFINAFSGGPHFARDIFGTVDLHTTILDTLEYATGIGKEHIYIQFCPNELFEKPDSIQGDRGLRVVALKTYYQDDGVTKNLVIHCDNFPHFTGTSLGVKYKSNKTSEEKTK